MSAPDSTGETKGSWAALKPFKGLLLALFVAEITGSFESAMIIAALKRLIEEFGDPVRVGWLVTAYLIVGAAAAALVGRLGDLFGRRRLMLVVLAIGVIGSLISAVGSSFEWVFAGRVLQGMTGAILPLSIGLVRENVPRDHVPMGIGLMISGASLGTAAGLVLGGWISDTYNWHGVFFASVAFCAAAWLAVRCFVPRSPRSVARLETEWFSAILFAPGIMLLLYYVSTIAKQGLFDRTGLFCLGMGTILLVWWVWRSLTAANPLLDIRQFRNRSVAVANIVTALVALSSLQITLVFSMLLQAPTWTGVGLGVTAFVAGLAKLPSNILSTFAGPLSGWLTGRGGGRSAMLAGGALATAGWIAVWFVHDSVPVVILILCITSFGTTILFAVGPTILAQAVSPDRTSEVSGMLTVVRGLSMGVGAMLVTSLLASDILHDPTSKAQYPTNAAFRLTIAVIALISLLATLCALALPRGRIQYDEAS